MNLMMENKPDIVKQKLVSYFDAKATLDVAKEKFNYAKAEIENLLIPEFVENGVKSIEVPFDMSTAKVTMVERKSKSYDANAYFNELWRGAVSKETYENTVKTVTNILDVDGLLAHLVEQGVDIELLTDYITFKHEVDIDKFINAHKLGFISEETYDKVYQETVTSRYIKATVK